jgi:hypothetical protein
VQDLEHLVFEPTPLWGVAFGRAVVQIHRSPSCRRGSAGGAGERPGQG